MIRKHITVTPKSNVLFLEPRPKLGCLTLQRKHLGLLLDGGNYALKIFSLTCKKVYQIVSEEYLIS